jgi:hypothetical protein
MDLKDYKKVFTPLDAQLNLHNLLRHFLLIDTFFKNWIEVCTNFFC